MKKGTVRGNEQSTEPARRMFSPMARGVMALVGVLVFASVVFRVAWRPDHVLFSTDSGIGTMAILKSHLPAVFTGAWVPTMLFGYGATWTVSVGNLLQWWLPVRIYTSFIYAIFLSVASLFLIAFLRMRKCSWAGCALGALTAFWLGTNLTLAYAGHIGKFGVLMFGAMSLWLIEKTIRDFKLGWALLAGAAVGGMFLEQQDVALFLGMFIGVYAVFAVVRERGWNVRALVLTLLPMALMAVLVGGPNVLRGYATFVKGVAQVSESSPEEQWEYCTQWSLPPGEVIDFVAPAFTGLRSEDPEGPYWGRTGRSAGWEQTRQGFRNLRLESIYLGAIPMLLAALALFTAFRNRRGAPVAPEGRGTTDDTMATGRRADVFFWGAAAVVAILLSFGKYFPLYQLFFHLPGVSSIRNPNKFVQVFQMAVGILAAHGLTAALARWPVGKASPAPAGKGRGFVILAGAFGGILLLAAMVVWVSRGAYIDRFSADGWGQTAPTIVTRMTSGLLHGGLMALLCAGALWAVGAAGRRGRRRLAEGLVWTLVAVVALDALLLSRHYIKGVDLESQVGKNGVVEYLQKNLNGRRCLALTQSGFYNHWLGGLLPYHDIPTFNVLQMPRMPAEYKRFLDTVGQNPVRMWQLASVGYILAPSQIWTSIQQDAGMRSLLEPVLGFNVFPWRDGVGIQEVAPAATAPHLLLKFRAGLPPWCTFSSWDVVDDEAVCQRLASPPFDPSKVVLVSADDRQRVPAPAGAVSGACVPASMVSVDRRRLVLRASPEQPSVLLFVQKHAPEWKATVNGRPVPVLRCNYLCMGVFLDAGDHEVVFSYDGPRTLLWVQAAGLLVCLAAAVSLMLDRAGRRDILPAEGGKAARTG